MQLMLVAVGGGAGAMLRFFVMRMAGAFLSPGFPYGVMAINIVGSLLMGILVGYGARNAMSEETRIFLSVGVLGGFTTFSAFSLDTVTLIERGTLLPAMIYVIGSVTCSVVALALGMLLMRSAG